MNKGFSLIELMIVVAIIGVLALIITPSYKVYTRRAHFVEIVQAATPYKIGIQECFQVTSSLTDCLAGINGVPPETTNAHGLIKSITVNHAAVITVTPNAKYGITSKDTYTLTPIVKNGLIRWTSGGGGVARGYAN